MADSQRTSEIEYRPIADFPGYRVGDDGSVWSCFRRGAVGQRRTLDGPWVRLKTHPSNKGHLSVQLYRYDDGAEPRVNIHRLVLEAFVGPCPTGKECCHGDGDPTNNALWNLRWGTRLENRADRARHGRARSWSKLTIEQVRQARAMRADGSKYREIGAALGISDTQASNICRRKQWQEVA